MFEICACINHVFLVRYYCVLVIFQINNLFGKQFAFLRAANFMEHTLKTGNNLSVVNYHNWNMLLI